MATIYVLAAMAFDIIGMIPSARKSNIFGYGVGVLHRLGCYAFIMEAVICVGFWFVLKPAGHDDDYSFNNDWGSWFNLMYEPAHSQ